MNDQKTFVPTQVWIVEDCGVDGKGTPSTVGVYTDHALAHEATSAYTSSRLGSVMVTPDGQAWLLAKSDPIVLNRNEIDFKRKLKQQALGKLSSEERKVLGYHDKDI